LPTAYTGQGKSVHGNCVVQQEQECMEEWHGLNFLV